MTTAQLTDWYGKVKAIDQHAGKLMGAAHIRADGYDWVSYVASLSGRVLLVGITAALLQAVFSFVFMLNDAGLTLLGTYAYGFLMIVLCGAIYRDCGFRLSLILTVGMASVIGEAAGLYSVPIGITLSLTAQWIGVPIGILLAMQILSFLVRTIASAFNTDSPQLPTIRKIRRAGLLTAEEIAQLREWHKRTSPWMIMMLSCEMLALLLGLCGIAFRNALSFTLAVGLLASLFVVLFAFCIRVWRLRVVGVWSPRKAIFARLIDEKILIVNPTEEVTTTMVKHGYTLNGAFHPAKD